jgi:hypothetical protein
VVRVVLDRGVGVEQGRGVDVLEQGRPIAPEPELLAPEADDGELAAVVGVVVCPAQQDQVVHVGQTTVDPMHHVVGFQVPGGLTPRVGAAPVVADGQGAVLLVADQALGAAQVQHVAGVLGVVDHDPDPARALQPRQRQRPTGAAGKRLT